MLVILYLFLGGCGGGILLVSTVGSLLFYQSVKRTREATRAFGTLMKHCYVVGFFAVALAAACLTLDLDQPARVLSLFTRPSGSVLSIGSFILLATILLAFVLVLANRLDVLRLHTKAKKLLEVLCALSSLLLITYVGIFLQSMSAVPFWNTFATPTLFVFSSLSTGIALLLLAASFSGGAEWLKKHLVKIHRVNRIVLLCEAAALALLLWQATLHATALRSLNLLLETELSLWFFVGAVGFGVIIPLLAELYAIVTRRASLHPPLYALCLLGGFCLRYCVVSAGMH